MPVAAKGKRLFGLTMIFWQCKKNCDTFLNFWYKKDKKTSTKKRIKMRRKKTWKFERIFLSCFAFFSSSQKLGSDSSCCPTCHCALSIRLIEDPGGWHHKVGVGGLASPTVTILKKNPSGSSITGHRSADLWFGRRNTLKRIWEVSCALFDQAEASFCFFTSGNNLKDNWESLRPTESHYAPTMHPPQHYSMSNDDD